MNRFDKEEERLQIIEEYLAHKITMQEARSKLGLSRRQVMRIVKEVRESGSAVHYLKEKILQEPHNKIPQDIRNKILTLAIGELKDYNYAHMRDILAEDYHIFVSRSTVERLCKAHDISSPRKKNKPRKYRRRNRRDCTGELVQLDASKEKWFYGDNCYYHLHGAIDDATGKIVGLFFCNEECLLGYTQILLQMNRSFGLPLAFYTDGRSVFEYKKRPATLEEELLETAPKFETNFARGCRAHNIDLITARTPQAKGRIERLWGTLQDRLLKDMKRKGIVTPEEANRFLPDYICAYNAKYAVKATQPESKWQPRHDEAMLKFDFAQHFTRKLDSGQSFTFKGQRYVLPDKDIYGNKIPAHRQSQVTVASGDLIGVLAEVKDTVCLPELYVAKPKTSIAEKPKTKQKHPPAPLNHPWRQYWLNDKSKKKK